MSKKRKRYLDLDKKPEEKKIEEKQVIELSPKVTFRAFFQKKVELGLLRPWQDKTLILFFKKKGLGDQEFENKYEEIFKIF